MAGAARVSHARTIGLMTALNLIGAVFAFCNSIVQANLFGTSRAMEVYFAVATLLTIITSLSQSGNLASIFLPIYHRLRKGAGTDAARAAFSVLLNWTVLASLAALVLLWWGAPLMVELLVPGFTDEDQRLAIAMFHWLLPLLPLTIAYNFLTTLANAERQFGKPEAIRVAQRIAVVVTTLLLYRPLGIWALVVSLWVGKLTGLIGQWAVMHRTGFRHRVRLSQPGFAVRSVFGHMAHSLGSSAALQLYTFSLTSALSLLPQGHFAVFKYVFQTFNHMQMALLRPVSTVFFTQISEAAAAASSRLKPIMTSALGQMLAIWALLLPAVAIAGEPILTGLWGSSVFGASEVALAADLLVAMLLTFLALAPKQLSVYTNLAVDAVRTQYFAHTVARLAAAGYAWLLIPRLGVWGAVLVLALNASAQMVASGAILWSRRKIIPAYPIAASLKLATAIAVGILAGLGASAALPVATADRIVRLLLGALVGMLSFAATGGAAWVLGVHEFRQLARRVGDFLASRGVRVAFGRRAD